MIPAFFFQPKVMEAVGVVLLVAAYTGFIYYKGGESPRADLQALKNNVAIADAAHKKLNASVKTASDAALIQLELEHEDAVAADTASWMSYIDSLPKPGSPIRTYPKPVRELTKVCGNENDNRLSDALQIYRSAVAEQLDRIEESDRKRRQDTAGLLKICSVQSIDLDEWKKFGLTLKTINSIAAKP